MDVCHVCDGAAVMLVQFGVDRKGVDSFMMRISLVSENSDTGDDQLTSVKQMIKTVMSIEVWIESTNRPRAHVPYCSHSTSITILSSSHLIHRPGSHVYTFRPARSHN